jgi:environmental stress-induced protein Ves
VTTRITRLDPAHYRHTPWKNRGGVTVDIADAYRPGTPEGSWDGMIWRLGYTRIETPGPFSDLTGHDRILVVTGGRGLVLERPEGPLDVREPLRPVRFRGEDLITSRLEAGPVAVLNLMADRARAAIDLAVLTEARSHQVAPGLHVLHALGPATVTIDGADEALPDRHSLRIDSEEGFLLALRDGTVALASIAVR